MELDYGGYAGRRRGSYIPNGEDAERLSHHFDMVHGRRGSIRANNLVSSLFFVSLSLFLLCVSLFTYLSPSFLSFSLSIFFLSSLSLSLPISFSLSLFFFKIDF